MKQLIIITHPKKDSFTHALAKSFIEESQKKGNTVDTLDLYQHKEAIEYLCLDPKKCSKKQNLFVKFSQKKISFADEIIFFFPMWNYAEPAILKSWYDLVFAPGFAFQYTGKLLPNKLLKGKSSKFFVTCDGPNWYYKIITNPLKNIWKRGRMEFSGIKVEEFKYIDQVRLMDEKKRKECIKSMKKFT